MRPTGLFPALRLSPLHQDLCIKATKEPWWLLFSGSFRDYELLPAPKTSSLNQEHISPWIVRGMALNDDHDLLHSSRAKRAPSATFPRLAKLTLNPGFLTCGPGLFYLKLVHYFIDEKTNKKRVLTPRSSSWANNLNQPQE